MACRSGALILVLASALGGCGRGGQHAAPAPAVSETVVSATVTPMPPTVTVKHDAALGNHLTDSTGHTLYLFTGDRRGAGSSKCDETCAATWHPFDYEGAFTAENGADPSLLGSIKRANGSTEVTYSGWPLYYYAGDRGAGDVKGEGLESFGGAWHAVSPGGNMIEGGAS